MLGTSEAIACTGAFEIDYFWYLGYLGKILYCKALDACAGYFPLFCRPRFSGLCGGWLGCSLEVALNRKSSRSGSDLPWAAVSSHIGA